MIYIAYIVFGFTVFQALVAALNLIFGQKMFHVAGKDDLVSILIPARNEEKNIANILSDIQRQSYPNLEVLIYNDQSTDATASIVESFTPSDRSIRLISSDGLPAGWLGKNYACYSLGKKAHGNYFLFLDADVRLIPEAIELTVNFLKHHQLSLLSIFPKQIMQTAGEQISVPLMNYILLTLLPLILVRKSGFVSLSAANGQFMFFNAEVYKKYQPHQALKESIVEDIQTARLFKKNKNKIACLAGTDVVQCRMYSSYKEAVNGFSKNVLMFFGNSAFISFVFWFITTLGFIPVLLKLSVFFTAIYFAMIILSRIAVSVKSNQNAIRNILFLIPQQFMLGVIIYTAIKNKFKRQLLWKGRNIRYK